MPIGLIPSSPGWDHPESSICRISQVKMTPIQEDVMYPVDEWAKNDPDNSQLHYRYDRQYYSEQFPHHPGFVAMQG